MEKATVTPIFDAAVEHTGIDPRRIASREKWSLADAKRQINKKGSAWNQRS